MAASDTYRLNDVMPFAPLSATASIYPAATPAPQEDLDTTWIGELGGPLPFGCDQPATGPEDRA